MFNSDHTTVSLLPGLTLKAPITTAADENFIYFFYFSEKTSLDISCESSAWQKIHMKCQDLLALKKKIRMSSATNFPGRFKSYLYIFSFYHYMDNIKKN